MGYACPVCAVPQADGEHLANHLAMTALLHDDEHATWLDEHAPGWASTSPADLAPRVTDLADETEYTAVFEDTTATATAGANVDGSPRTDLDAESRRILDDALALTDERRRTSEADERENQAENEG